MVLDMKVNTSTVKNKEKESSNGKMVLDTTEIFTIIIFMVQVHTNGLIAEPLLVIGIVIKCMAVEYSHGKMEENTRDNIRMIKNMDKVPFNGLMAEVTEVNGLMVNNTVKVIIKVVKEPKDTVNGEKVEELNG